MASLPDESLDGYFKAKPARVDFLKMDIQGAEYKAFKGMRELLQQNPNIIVMTEFWPQGLEQAGTAPKDLLDEVRKYGFRIYRIGEKGIRETSDSDLMNSLMDEGAYANLIFSREKL